MNSDGTSARVSNSPTNSVWFNRFMMGMHKRMGDVNRPDMAVDRYVIRGCFEVAQTIWDNNPMDDFARKEIEKAICIVISGYFGGLRGEEIAKGDRGAMMDRWRDSMSHEEMPFVPLTLLGRFKRETGEKVFVQPLAAVTKGGRSLEIWFAKLLTSFKREGKDQGPLFPNEKEKAMTISEMDVLFHALLNEVQKRNPAAIPDHIKVEESYSVSRSLRRGATSEAQNVDIPSDVINANNRWRKDFRSKGIRPSGSMLDHYSEARVMAPTLTKFSKELPS